jgi:hypothetical protein
MRSPRRGFRNGFARLIPAKEVRQFAEQYIATSILAKRFNLDGGALARYLRESGTPLLAIPIPDAGKGLASFLQKSVAASIKLPSREMLREAAQHRIVAEKETLGRLQASQRSRLG